ncbi:hypothetical protein GA0116948_1095 [Chitinophaga costaii]|uniref:SnoaL-like domain-containing protein n=1 Tax=Chitinophaga costaii TaxID=1335309 RepID=A0A1C4EKY8_9BACT|nr:nuclear transport factor 2 family protein [Chitinophaga costaii]PUZ22420.1 nuclear transport factor 2 family protein [Chitinophaga costaii]SCC44305.1 hypothetical protein GA0116948_1095 [Chitinophaga costaii]
MTTQEIATTLVGLLRAGNFEEAQKKLLAQDAVSIEPNATFFPKETVGLANILNKGAKFREGIEKVNSLTISEPLVAGNTIALTFTLDADFKGNGKVVFTEVCVFLVSDGKIVQEVYYY